MKEEFVSTVQHAVIIAAGSGERFRDSTHHGPKPLLEVAGVPLISRTIRTANQAGICSFTIITGHRAGMLEAFLDAKALAGVNIRCIRNEEWQRANGLSTLKAKGAVPEPFVLLMADHLFDAEIIRRLLTSTLPADHCRLAVDFHPGQNIDLEDATKVQVVDGRISDIGKDISDYNAIDTGIFLCSNALFEALETAISLGQESLSDGIRELARNQQMEATDIGDLFWQDVDNEKDLKAGERLLTRSLVSETDSWLTRQINRRISLFVTRRLAASGIKPIPRSDRCGPNATGNSSWVCGGISPFPQLIHPGRL
jgi:choline kinase